MKKTLKEWRKEKGISAETVASALDIPVKTYTSMEKDANLISVLDVERICKVIGVHPNDVIWL